MLEGLLTKVPKAPPFHPVDFGKIESQAATDYANLLPQLQPLAEKFNQLSGDELNKALERQLPGYKNLVNKTTGNITSLASGEIPQDVQTFLARKVAEQGAARGTAGSQFDTANLLGTYGRTSLQLAEEGIGAAQRWIESAASRTPVFNFASMFTPIGQRVGIREAEAQFQWQRDWLRNKLSAIPTGWTAAVINLANDVEQIGRSVLSSYAGGMGGGGNVQGSNTGSNAAASRGSSGGTLNSANEGLSSWAEY